MNPRTDQATDARRAFNDLWEKFDAQDCDPDCPDCFPAAA